MPKTPPRSPRGVSSSAKTAPRTRYPVSKTRRSLASPDQAKVAVKRANASPVRDAAPPGEKAFRYRPAEMDQTIAHRMTQPRKTQPRRKAV